MQQHTARLKRAYGVTCGESPVVGCVKRLARDGRRADVDWETHTRRMPAHVLQVQATLHIGEWEVTDITRQNELDEAARQWSKTAQQHR